MPLPACRYSSEQRLTRKYIPTTPPHLHSAVISCAWQGSRKDVLPSMPVALPSLPVIDVLATVALEAHRRAANEADRGVQWDGLAALAHEGRLVFAEKCVQHDGKAGDAVDGGAFQDDSAVELRSSVGVSVMRAPAR